MLQGDLEPREINGSFHSFHKWNNTNLTSSHLIKGKYLDEQNNHSNALLKNPLWSHLL